MSKKNNRYTKKNHIRKNAEKVDEVLARQAKKRESRRKTQELMSGLAQKDIVASVQGNCPKKLKRKIRAKVVKQATAKKSVFDEMDAALGTYSFRIERLLKLDHYMQLYVMAHYNHVDLF